MIAMRLCCVVVKSKYFFRVPRISRASQLGPASLTATAAWFVCYSLNKTNKQQRKKEKKERAEMSSVARLLCRGWIFNYAIIEINCNRCQSWNFQSISLNVLLQSKFAWAFVSTLIRINFRIIFRYKLVFIPKVLLFLKNKEALDSV